jgi:hypothetical protein
MADPKTRRTKASALDFLRSMKDEARRRGCRTLITLMSKVTGERPRMWGSSIVGFGSYRYRYASGRAGDWPRSAFSPRKQDLRST